MKRKRKQRIGILGGAFNPIHYGHLKIAQKAREKFKLDHVLFVPCFKSPYKSKNKLISAKDRLAMVELGTKKFRHFFVSPIEIERIGVSYSIQTLRELKKSYPFGTRFFFILGSDAFSQLATWKEVGKLVKLCDFVPFNREGFPLPKKGGGIKNLKWQQLKNRPIKISATEIREKVKIGKALKSFVPKEVEEYIKRKKLYKK